MDYNEYIELQRRRQQAARGPDPYFTPTIYQPTGLPNLEEVLREVHGTGSGIGSSVGDTAAPRASRSHDTRRKGGKRR